MKKILLSMTCLLVCIPLISPSLGTIEEKNSHPMNTGMVGLQIHQVNFRFDKVTVLNSNWGTLEININEFLEQANMDEGYLNFRTNTGWVLQNQFVNKVIGHKKLYIDFNLGNEIGTDVRSLSLFKTFTKHPVESFEDGPRENFPVDDVDNSAEGCEDDWTTQIGTPMQYIDFDIDKQTFNFTKPLSEGENIQCACNQCYPMAVANSLQYLEDNYFNVVIPHDHVIGLKGDNSLVGQLDFYTDRNVTNRSEGEGVSNTRMLKGKFEYLNSIGLTNVLVHRHQGDGKDPNDPDPPLVDFTYAGITSIDESVNGNVTFDWLYTQLKNCSDVEIGYFRDGGGGHAIRVVGGGKTAGQPWIRYIHDSAQTCLDPNDLYGLQETQVFVTDLDGDGMMNVGSLTSEIGFALAETAKAIEIIKITGGLGVAVDIKNFGPLPKNDLPWSIVLQAPLMFLGGSTEGKINLPPYETISIKSTMPIGFGFAQMKINVGDAQVNYRGFIFGPLVIPFKDR